MSADDFTPPAPWELQPGEPTEAHALFERFACTTWSARTFAEAQGEAPARVAALSSRYRWLARREALNLALTRSRVSGAIETAKEQGAEHARATAIALDWGIDSMIARRAKGEILEPREALAFVKLAIELQRLAAGEPTARIAADLSHVPDARLEELRAKFAKALEDATRDDGEIETT